MPDGKCGINLSWQLEGTTLTISGTGDMEDYGWILSKAPWRNHAKLIKEAIISKNAFRNCEKMESIIIADTVTNVGGAAFISCWNLKYITIPYGVTSINKEAFS